MVRFLLAAGSSPDKFLVSPICSLNFFDTFPPLLAPAIDLTGVLFFASGTPGVPFSASFLSCYDLIALCAFVYFAADASPYKDFHTPIIVSSALVLGLVS